MSQYYVHGQFNLPSIIRNLLDLPLDITSISCGCDCCINDVFSINHTHQYAAIFFFSSESFYNLLLAVDTDPQTISYNKNLKSITFVHAISWYVCACVRVCVCVCVGPL